MLRVHRLRWEGGHFTLQELIKSCRWWFQMCFPLLVKAGPRELPKSEVSFATLEHENNKCLGMSRCSRTSSVLSSWTICHGGHVPCLCCPRRKPRATHGCQALGMWLPHRRTARSILFTLINLKEKAPCGAWLGGLQRLPDVL